MLNSVHIVHVVHIEISSIYIEIDSILYGRCCFLEIQSHTKLLQT